MRWSRGKTLLAAGAGCVVIGTALTVAFAAAQSTCQGTTSDFLPRTVSPCRGDGWGAAIGFAVLVVGGLLVLASAIVSTPRFSDRRDAVAATPTPETAGDSEADAVGEEPQPESPA